MRRAGLLSLGLPAALGGPETSVAAAMRAIEQWHMLTVQPAGT
jgi:hypothetical protein